MPASRRIAFGERHLVARPDAESSRATRCRPTSSRSGRRRASSSARASSTDCSMSQPPSAQSVAEMRTNSGTRSGQTRPDRVHHLEQQARAVVERPAVLVVARDCSAATGTRAAGSRARRGSRPRRNPPARARAAPPRRRRATTSRDPVARQRLRAPDSRRRTASALGARPAASRPPPAERRRGPSHGRRVLALRPACASCMPATRPARRRTATIRASGSMCSSLQMPRSSGLIRPSAVTAVASVITSARAADRAAAEMDEVPVVGEAVLRSSTGTSARRRRDWRT